MKKRKRKKKVNQAPEVVGISIIGCCVLIIASIFTEQAGMIGNAIKYVTVGMFGLGGYMLPFYILYLGFTYIRNGKKCIENKISKAWPIFIMIVFGAELLSKDMPEILSVYLNTYFADTTFINGGLIGSIVVNVLVKFLGLYGTYIVILGSAFLYVFKLYNFSFVAWIKAIPSLEPKQPKRRQRRSVSSVKVAYREPAPAARATRKVSYQEPAPAARATRKAAYQEPAPAARATRKAAYQEPAPAAPAPKKKSPVYAPVTMLSPKDNPKANASPAKPAVDQPKIYVMENTQNEIRKRKTKRPVNAYQFPDIELLVKQENKNSGQDTMYLQTMATKLEDTLKCFGIEARVAEVYKGPSVTRYELAPKQGIKVSKILNLSDDIALSLAAKRIRIEAPIPGKPLVGIEIPNAKAETVFLRDIIDTNKFDDYPSKLAFAIGKDISGAPVIHDIAKMPHVLIAGATGSGKSVCINTLVASILYKAAPTDVKLLMIDPKVVELNVYNGIPHLLRPVVTDPKEAAAALNSIVEEMTMRYKLFAENMVRDIKGFNKKADRANKMPHIVVIIDELSDLMMTAAKEVEDSICRLAQMARAAGIHLVIATQRPSVDVITGIIKANIPSRMAFAVSSGVDSRTILDSVGAEKLLGKGDMLFCPMGESKPIRIQGAFISDTEVEELVDSIKSTQYAKLA